MSAEHKHRPDLKDRISEREREGKGRVITDIRAFQKSNRTLSASWLAGFSAAMNNFADGACRATAALQKC